MFELMHSLREYKKQTIWTIFFVTLEVIMEVLSPYLMANLIDHGIYGGNMPIVLKTGLMILVFYTISLICGFLAGHYAAIAAVGFSGNLRSDLFRKVQGFAFTNIDRFSAASIVTRLTTDINNVQMAYQVFIRIAVRSPLLIIFALLMTMKIQIRIVPIFLVIIPVLGVILMVIASKVFPMYRKVFKTYDRLNNDVEENLKGIRVVKAYVREDYEEQKFNDITQEIFVFFSKAQKFLAAAMPLMQAAIFASILIVSWYGAHFIVERQMNTGQIVSLVQYAFQILIGLMNLSFIYVMLTISQVASKRIKELMEEKSDIKEIDTSVNVVKNGVVSFEHVDFSYTGENKELTLEDINFSVQSGENIGIIGGSGAGKSTLISLIPRLYDVTGGTLKVSGIDVKDYELEALREAVAVVLQKNTLFSGTVAENIRWGKEDATDEEIIEACKKAQADDFIQEFDKGYETHIEQGGSNVSGGQRQRLCIARALIKNPKILILDDSTSAVDTTTESKIRDVLNHELKHLTKFIISQRIVSVKDCDKILVMDGGKIVGIGTHEKLIETNDIYREIYETQEKGGMIGGQEE